MARPTRLLRRSCGFLNRILTCVVPIPDLAAENRFMDLENQQKNKKKNQEQKAHPPPYNYLSYNNWRLTGGNAEKPKEGWGFALS